jgi:alkyl sulfatase BDS1-like metallo-beta-lactamase superfamily hydrolase
MGGADAILARAAKDFAKGEFRFVAQAISHLVFAEPDNQAARARLADTFEQLGYLAESATWRNAYLFGAQELRQGMPKAPPRPPMPRETLAALRTGQLWDVLGVRLNGPKAEGKRIVLNWSFTDTNESFVLTLENCALTYVAGAQAAAADASFTLSRGTLDEVIAKQTSFPEAVASGKIRCTGNAMRLAELMALMDAHVRDRRTEADARELTRDCEPTGRANARPMTGSAKQSMVQLGEAKAGLLSSLLALTLANIVALDGAKRNPGPAVVTTR